MSFPLYLLLEAQKISQLPKMLQGILNEKANGNEWFQEKFLDLEEKDRWVCIKDTMNTCLENGLHQERAFYLVMYRQEIRGETIDEDIVYRIEDDCEENDIQKVNCGTQTEPIAIQTEEVKQEVQVPTIMPDEPPARKNSRRYCTMDGEFFCFTCRLNLASSGSLHNHYHSKLHSKSLKKRLDVMRTKVQIGDKVIVDVRNKGRDPDLSWEITDEEEIEETFKPIEKYLMGDTQQDNPITHTCLRRPVKKTKLSGQEYIYWTTVDLK